jgi:hypothetical protein
MIEIKLLPSKRSQERTTVGFERQKRAGERNFEIESRG